MKSNHQEPKPPIKSTVKYVFESDVSIDQSFFFSSIIEQTREGIAVVDLEGNLCFVNDAFAAMHGYSPDELAGKHRSVFHTPDQMAAVEAANAELKRTGAFIGEIWHVRKDGTFFPALVHNSLFRDKTGNSVGMIGTLRDMTDLKRAETALKESEKKYQSLLERANDGIGIIQDGRLTYVNTRLADMGGYRVEELIDQPFAKYVHPDEVSEATEYYDRRMKGKEVPEKVERRLLHKDGSTLYVWISGGVISCEDKPANLIIAHDITDRKMVEQALRESEERFRLTFEHAVDAIFWADPGTGVIIKCNKSAEILLRKRKDEIVGRHQTTIHPADKSDYYRAMFVRHVKQAEALDEEGEIVTKSGERVPVHITASTIVVGGTPIVQGIFRDISERKLAEEKLYKSEVQYRTIVQDQTELICRFLPDGTLTFVNEPYLRYFKKEAKDLVGRTFLSFIPEEERSKVQRELASLSPERPVSTHEHRVMAGDGQIRWQQWTNRVVFDENGCPDEFQAVGRDITDMKQAQEALRASRDELERRVDERTAELRELNEQLTREIQERRLTEQELLVHHRKIRSLSSELALAEERERRRIAVEVHDRIAQNLAFAKINLKSLQSRKPSRVIVGALGEVIKLLDETIHDTRSLIAELAPPILYELGLVPAVESLVQKTQKVHGITFEFEDDGMPKPLSDDLRVLLFRAVRELIVNIIKHAQATRAKVSVRAKDKWICIEVGDDGSGFDTSELDYTGGDGECFGFFSIQQRLHPLGGHLHVEAQRGRGTRVTLMAPLKIEGEKERAGCP
jgi:PAS domain S-box-containing protein